MRFVFPNGEELRAREQLLARVDELFERAAQSSAELVRAPAHACGEFFCSALCEIDERLDADVIDARDGERWVVFNARGERSLAPLLAAIEARVPELEGLRVTCSGPTQPSERAIARVKSELDVDLSEARARAGFARGHLLELVIYASTFTSSADERALDAAELLVSSLLGDRVFDDWIGEVRVAPMPRKSLLPVVDNDRIEERSFPIAELAETVGAAIEGVRAGLPECVTWQRARDGEQGWTMFELEPELSHDYESQDDLAIATTLAPEMLKCFLRGQPFSSLRFSRHGEHFAYLKLDGEARSTEQRLEARRALEDELAESLVGAGLGDVVGNGIGVRYSYVDLALGDLNASIECVRAVARSHAVPARSWLLFCDSDLAAEWVGVWDETPPPPFTR